MKFRGFSLFIIKRTLWILLKNNPLLQLGELVTIMKQLGISINRMWISRQLKKWCWTFKKPNYKQIWKYTNKNINYYLRYMVWIANKP